MGTTLFIFSGLPASGKSTLAKYVSKKYNALYLRIDTVEQGLRDLCNYDVQGEGYKLSYRIANDNLKLGNSVVSDSCNPINLTRSEWEEIARKSKCKYFNIEVLCSDPVEHRKRLEERGSEVENLQPLTWHEVVNRTYHPWEKERIVIDKAHKSIDCSVKELIDKIEQQGKK